MATNRLDMKKILQGDVSALAKAITLIESDRDDDKKQAIKLMSTILPHTGKAVRLGISGSPGVGKSTLIEALGMHLVGEGKRVAVLAVDPSSAHTKGSLLGDKTRMQKLATHERAFVRPSPSRGMLGGVSPNTRETMLLCEAAGFDVVIIETVGVGQSEAQVASMVDVFLLMVLPSGGDELQAIKKGILEVADIIVVNKADGDLQAAAEETKRQYARAARKVPILLTSALMSQGISELWQAVLKYHANLVATHQLGDKRATQNEEWLIVTLRNTLWQRFHDDKRVLAMLPKIREQVRHNKLSMQEASERLLDVF